MEGHLRDQYCGLYSCSACVLSTHLLLGLRRPRNARLFGLDYERVCNLDVDCLKCLRLPCPRNRNICVPPEFDKTANWKSVLFGGPVRLFFTYLPRKSTEMKIHLLFVRFAEPRSHLPAPQSPNLKAPQPTYFGTGQFGNTRQHHTSSTQQVHHTSRDASREKRRVDSLVERRTGQLLTKSIS